MYQLKALLLVPALVLFQASAAPAVPNSDQAAFPQKSLLAASGNLSTTDLAIPLPAGMKMGQLPAIAGGVSRNGKGLCAYTVSNNFEKTVQVNLSVRQYNAKAQKISSSSAAWTLKPAETQKGQVSESSATAGCALVLESWRAR
ncbi:MAG: hypothetical protein J0M12_15385 [Deltaproteobacteria bacterium]|nr:hypothetical protein [Deltaproteobacteria bacterium]